MQELIDKNEEKRKKEIQARDMRQTKLQTSVTFAAQLTCSHAASHIIWTIMQLTPQADPTPCKPLRLTNPSCFENIISSSNNSVS